MPQKETAKAAGGRYVCHRCEEAFTSIMDLRVHEKFCRNGERHMDLEKAASGAVSAGENQSPRQ